MVQYFNISENVQDDPVLFELDVYLNNPTLADIIPDLHNLPDNLSFLTELYNRPFERLLILQYPLELPNHINESSEYKTKKKFLNLNTSDKLTLKSLEIGESYQIIEPITKKSYLNKFYKSNRRTKSPLVRLTYDLGPSYLSNYRSSFVNNSYKPSFSPKSQPELKTSPKFGPTSHEVLQGNTLILDSTVATNEHVIDCLGVLKVERINGELKREFHLLPVKAILQLRPSLDSLNEELSPDEQQPEPFYKKNIHWKTIDSIFFEDSRESKELVEFFSNFGRKSFNGENANVNFITDREMYVNSLCVPADGTLASFQSQSVIPPNIKNIKLKKITYTKMVDSTPNLRFMKKLNVKLQLRLLLSQRVTDSFSSLKRDIVLKGLDDDALVEILQEFAKQIGGNWVLNSEHAIENYTEDDDFTTEEREYLIACRNLMLSLLNRHTLMPLALKANTSVGHLTSDQFVNASGLPLKLVNEILTTISKPQGKFWVPKLKKDDEFCQKYPHIVTTFQKYWIENVPKSANVIQSFKLNFRVNHIVRNILIKRAISDLIKDRIYSHESIMEHLESMGFSQQHDNIEPLLHQVGACINKRFWTYKKTNRFLMALKKRVEASAHRRDRQMPDFVLRRIYKFTM